MDVRSLVGGTVVGAVVLAGCGTEESPTTTGPGGAAASPAADLPTSYRYRLVASCGERAFLGTYDVAVREGEVILAEPHERRSRVPLRDVPTLQDLLDLADSADADAEVDLQLDDDGLPVSLSIDHIPGAIDDEECYRVSRLVLRR